MPGTVGGVVEFNGTPKCVRCLRQSAGGLLDLRYVIQGLGGIHVLTGNGQSFGLPEQGTLVMRSPGNRCRVFHERFLEVAQPEQHAAEARVRQRA
jgi:hypothetical protein